MTPKPIQRADKTMKSWPYRRVFLTGATGLIGGQLLHDLLMVPQVEEVTCLVREGNGHTPQERLESRLKRTGLRAKDLEKLMKRVRWASGEMTKELWGMDQAELDHVRQNVDLFINCAASTSFVDIESCEAINVTGTRRMLDILEGASNLKRLLHFSTATLCGHVPNTVMKEDDSLTRGGVHVVAYTRTKAEAERILWAQADKLPLLVVRPSITMARTSRDRKHARLFLWSLIAMVQLPFVPVKKESRIDIVPLDFVVKSTIQLLAKGNNLKHNCYHLTAGEIAAVTADEVRAAACKAGSVKGPKFIPPTEWSEKHMQKIEELELGTLYEALLLYLPFINLNLVYDNTRLIEELGENFPPLPKFDQYVGQMLHIMAPDRVPASAVEGFGL